MFPLHAQRAWGVHPPAGEGVAGNNGAAGTGPVETKAWTSPRGTQGENTLPPSAGEASRRGEAVTQISPMLRYVLGNGKFTTFHLHAFLSLS